jgi:serine/threonine protein kinase
MSNELVPLNDADCERVLNEVAMPLFDLRDTSLQALDQSNSTPGDLQSQLLLAYRGSETPARVFSRSFFTSNRLGLFKCIQAYLPIPVFVGTIAGFELPAIAAACHVEGIFMQLLLVYIAISIFSFLAVVLASVLRHRRKSVRSPHEEQSSFANVFEPDHVAISPQGINLQWSAKYFSFMGLVLPWKRIALAYVEEHVDATSGEAYEILCIRDNVGKALRLDCRVFTSSVLIKALQKRAPWAVKAPPMVLALQPVQLFRWQYLVKWSYNISKNLSDRTAAPAGIAQAAPLKNGKYKIIETLPVRKFGIEHLAEVVTESGTRDSNLVAIKGLNLNDQTVSSCSTKVRIQQFVLPPRQKFFQWYWTINHFEHEVRRLSCVNSNNITRWLDVFVENGSAFVVTEYDASKSLRQIVRESGRMSESRVREIALELCEILIHLHQLDPPYVHKALTPDALVEAKEGFVKLNLFSVGQQLVPSQMFASYFDRRYMSLELLRDRASHQSDIYSFGCILFFLLTGEDPKPFQQSNPRNLYPEISERFNEVVLKSTEPAASQRFDSAQEIKELILELANSETRLALL